MHTACTYMEQPYLAGRAAPSAFDSRADRAEDAPVV